LSLKEDIEKIILKEAVIEDQDLRRLSDFYQEMRTRGVVLRKHYDLPSLDTLGRHPKGLSGSARLPSDRRRASDRQVLFSNCEDQE
jgi:hypothetical protein